MRGSTVKRCFQVTALLACLFVTIPAEGRAQAPSFSASIRARWENWNWFPAAADGSYAYFGLLARVGVSVERKAIAGTIEFAAPVLLGLPDNGVAPAPQGQLGLGAAYWAANDSAGNSAGLFLKQAQVRLGAPVGGSGHGVRLGRFEFVDGGETAPAQPNVAALKRERIAHRLIGNFGWSHAQRSFDGAHYYYNASSLNLTAAALRPTQGVFRTNGWPELDVTLLYGALSSRAPSPQTHDWRLFGLFYHDGRAEPVKVDNRTLVARQADDRAIAISTFGGHYIKSRTAGPLTFDALGWFAAQTGNWGVLEHRAHAFALELGAQSSLPGKPWVRAGINRSSGDDAATDDRHGTFFPVLPTPRPYARFPFYTHMNLDDRFVSVSLSPTQRIGVRAEAHRLRLTDRADGWYAGGGAFEDTSFGYGMRPSNDENDLGALFDVSAQVRLQTTLTVNGYASWARGGEVIRRIYPEGKHARLAYLEVEWRR